MDELYSMAKRRRKLSPELEKNISLAKKQIELITAIIHDIDEDDIQEEYKLYNIHLKATFRDTPLRDFLKFS